jgi:hypothetical protein
MTRLVIAAVLAALTGLSAQAQDPRHTVTGLEGVWREPMREDERVEEMLAVMFTGQEITMTWCGEIYRGSYQPDPDRDPGFVRFAITLTDRKGEYLKRSYNGLCLLKDDQLFIQVQPAPPAVETSKLHLAPVSFRLEKHKK